VVVIWLGAPLMWLDEMGTGLWFRPKG
jgi:hypothetical protein